jgi:hypothetical protein
MIRRSARLLRPLQKNDQRNCCLASEFIAYLESMNVLKDSW